MSDWRPTVAELTKPFRQPDAWSLSLEGFAKGIDNAHLDVLVSPRLTAQIRDTVRKLLLADLSLPASAWQGAQPLHGLRELEAFRDGYIGVFEATLERSQADSSPDLLVLFQLALVKFLLHSVAAEGLRLQGERKRAAGGNGGSDSGRSLAVLQREGQAATRRVLRLLFRQLERLEREQVGKLRRSVAGRSWPLPESALFNPVLTVLELGRFIDLVPDYPVALLADTNEAACLFQTNQCVTKVFQHYLPAWTQMPSHWATGGSAGAGLRERLDQGQLRGFVDTEILLKRFVPVDEFRQGRRSWLDEPENLRLFLDYPNDPAADGFADTPAPRRGHWEDPRWPAFQQAVTGELHRCLDLQGLTRSVTLLYLLSDVRTPSGRPLPLAPVMEYADGRLSRRRFLQRLERLRVGMDPASIVRLVDDVVANVKRPPAADYAPYLNRYLVDFLALRRDLKLAYLAYESMDAIRLLEDAGDINLSRSNGTLIELSWREEESSSARRIRAHTVIKADLRGSTTITEELRARGLNPASHFSLNFFDPVNRLLPEFGAEKLFVEGDAVILAIFEHEGEGAGLSVARACGLAQKILQVVALQNAHNARHGLPALELGLGIAYSREEPNFLFDEGRRIMISAAINRADRLSACSSSLRSGGFAPESGAFRVTVVSNPAVLARQTADGDLMEYNVDGIRIDQDAFFKLQREVRLRQVRLPDDELGDTLFFAGFFPDLAGRGHWLTLRYGPVRAWQDGRLGEVDPSRRHFFEVIVDEDLSAKVRRLARGEAA